MLSNRRTKLYTGFSTLMLAGLVFTAGCAGSGGPAGAPPGAPKMAGRAAGMPSIAVRPVSTPVAPVAKLPSETPVLPDAEKPKPDKPDVPQETPGVPKPSASDAKDKKPLLTAGNKIEQAGNTIELASAIVDANNNPFLGKLPKPIIEPASDGGTGGQDAAAALPPADPFEGINLLGIVYNTKSPLALLSVGGGQSQSQLVRKGDLLMMAGGQLKVASISKDGIEVESLGEAAQKRTLSLPSIIGFGTAKETGTGASGETGLESSPAESAPTSKSRARSRLSEDGSGLGNLKKLGSDPSKVDLKEP